jgi:type IV secretion system protein VirB6
MYRKQLALIILFFLIKLSFCCVHAADFYQTCLLPSSIGSNRDVITITPLDSQCQKICKKECDAFSSQFNPYTFLSTDSLYAKNGAQELNEDVILDCYAQCQKGVDQTKCSTPVEKAAGCQFKSRYFLAFQASCDDEKNQDIFYKVCVKKDGNGYAPASGCTESLACNPGNLIGYISFYKTLQAETGIGMMCPSDQDNSYNAVQTTYTATTGDTFNLSLAGGASQNQLFLCGRKHLSVVPIFNNTNMVNNNDWFQFNWKNKNSHRYLATLDDSTFSTLSTLAGAQAHWNKILADTTLSSLAAGWGARNPNFFDTGINLQNGDMISITWTGDYSYKGTGFSVIKSDKNGSSSLSIPYADRQQLVLQCLWNNNVSDKSTCQTIWYNNSHLRMKDPNSGGNLQLLGEEFRVGGVESFGVLSSNKEPKSKIAQDSGVSTLYSLGGQVTDLDLIQSYVPGIVTYTDIKGAGVSVDCTCSESSQASASGGGDSQNGCQNKFSNYNCISSSTFKAGQGQYTLGGTLQSDQFKNRGKFELMHFDDDGGPPDWYSDNTGGYSLEIDWSGCPKSNGENIQYTIAVKDSKPDNTAKWVDITNDDLQQGNFRVAADAFSTGCQPGADGCVVFLRIKLETPDSGVAAGIVDSYQYYNTFGQYNINFSKQGASGDDSNMCAEKGFVLETRL